MSYKLTNERLLNSWNGFLKLYIAINWFSGNVQTIIFVAEHEGLINMNENLLNRLLLFIVQVKQVIIKLSNVS